VTISPQTMRPLGMLERVRLGTEVLAAYARVRWLLRTRNADEAVARLRRPLRRHPISAHPDVEQVVGLRLARAVVLILKPLPTDVRCLSRSLTLLTILERRSLHPKLVISVRPQPFAAHAWVELHGRPLLPVADPDHERLTEL
jgi:Transglutaminase-like superfamily